MEKESFKNKFKKIVNKKSFISFMEKQGFYIVLLLCLCIIGVTAFLTSDNRLGLRGTDDPGLVDDITVDFPPDDLIDISISDIIEKYQTDELAQNDKKPGEGQETGDGQQKAINTDNPSGSGKSVPNNDETVNANAGIEVPVNANIKVTESPQVMMFPVEGNILKEYIMDELVYSRTLKEWTTHTGMDLAAPLGSEVKAAMSGTVEAIHEDPLRGIVITLAHDEGLKTVYAGLSTKDMVQLDQKVEQGQVISGVGRTAAFEISDDPHLHFEVLLNGEVQDPMEYIVK